MRGGTAPGLLGLLQAPRWEQGGVLRIGPGVGGVARVVERAEEPEGDVACAFDPGDCYRAVYQEAYAEYRGLYKRLKGLGERRRGSRVTIGR